MLSDESTTSVFYFINLTLINDIIVLVYIEDVTVFPSFQFFFGQKYVPKNISRN